MIKPNQQNSFDIIQIGLRSQRDLFKLHKVKKSVDQTKRFFSLSFLLKRKKAAIKSYTSYNSNKSSRHFYKNTSFYHYLRYRKKKEFFEHFKQKYNKNSLLVSNTNKGIFYGLGETLRSPYSKRIFKKTIENVFFPYRKSFLCYWLLPFVGFIYTLNNKGEYPSFPLIHSKTLESPLLNRLDRDLQLLTPPLSRARRPLDPNPFRGSRFGLEGRLEDQKKVQYLKTTSEKSWVHPMSRMNQTQKNNNGNKMICFELGDFHPNYLVSKKDSSSHIKNLIKNNCTLYLQSLEHYLTKDNSSIQPTLLVEDSGESLFHLKKEKFPKEKERGFKQRLALSANGENKIFQWFWYDLPVSTSDPLDPFHLKINLFSNEAPFTYMFQSLSSHTQAYFLKEHFLTASETPLIYLNQTKTPLDAESLISRQTSPIVSFKKASLLLDHYYKTQLVTFEGPFEPLTPLSFLEETSLVNKGSSISPIQTEEKPPLFSTLQKNFYTKLSKKVLYQLLFSKIKESLNKKVLPLSPLLSKEVVTFSKRVEDILVERSKGNILVDPIKNESKKEPSKKQHNKSHNPLSFFNATKKQFDQINITQYETTTNKEVKPISITMTHGILSKFKKTASSKSPRLVVGTAWPKSFPYTFSKEEGYNSKLGIHIRKGILKYAHPFLISSKKSSLLEGQLLNKGTSQDLPFQNKNNSSRIRNLILSSNLPFSVSNYHKREYYIKNQNNLSQNTLTPVSLSHLGDSSKILKNSLLKLKEFLLLSHINGKKASSEKISYTSVNKPQTNQITTKQSRISKMEKLLRSFLSIKTSKKHKKFLQFSSKFNLHFQIQKGVLEKKTAFFKKRLTKKLISCLPVSSNSIRNMSFLFQPLPKNLRIALYNPKKQHKEKDSISYKLSPRLLVKNRLFIKDLTTLKSIISPFLESMNPENDLNSESRKTIQKKRRKKKLKKETRRRKKRKRFYPRPLWIRYRLLNFLSKKRHRPFLDNLDQKKALLSLINHSLEPYEIPTRHKVKSLRNPLQELLDPSKRFYEKTKQQGRLKTRVLPLLRVVKKEKIRSESELIIKRKQIQKNQNTILSLNASKDLYKISRNVLGDLNRLLWKSYWLNSNLNPYLKTVKNSLNQMKKTTQHWEASFSKTLKSLLLYLGGFDVLTLQSPWPRVSTQETLLNPCFSQNRKARFGIGTNNTGPLINLSNVSGGVLRQNNGFSKWQTALYLAEYNRISYQRIQTYISQIRENLTPLGEIKARSPHLGHSSTQRMVRKREMDFQKNADFWVKFGKRVVTFTEGNSQKTLFNPFFEKEPLMKFKLTPIRYQLSLNQKTPQLRRYWALSKTYLGFFKDFNKRNQLWTLEKKREQTKNSKTKKMSKMITDKFQDFLQNEEESFYSRFWKNADFSKKIAFPIGSQFIAQDSMIETTNVNSKLQHFNETRDVNLWSSLLKKSLKKIRQKELKALFYGFQPLTNNEKILRTLKKQLQKRQHKYAQKKNEFISFEEPTILRNNPEGGRRNPLVPFLTQKGKKEKGKLQFKQQLKHQPYFIFNTWSNQITHKSAYWWARQSSIFQKTGSFFTPLSLSGFSKRPFENKNVLKRTCSQNPMSIEYRISEKIDTSLIDLETDLNRLNINKNLKNKRNSFLFDISNHQILWISTLLFHFCTILSLLSISQIRSVLKTVFLGFSKIYKSSNKSLLFVSDFMLRLKALILSYNLGVKHMNQTYVNSKYYYNKIKEIKGKSIDPLFTNKTKSPQTELDFIESNTHIPTYFKPHIYLPTFNLFINKPLTFTIFKNSQKGYSLLGIIPSWSFKKSSFDGQDSLAQLGQNQKENVNSMNRSSLTISPFISKNSFYVTTNPPLFYTFFLRTFSLLERYPFQNNKTNMFKAITLRIPKKQPKQSVHFSLKKKQVHSISTYGVNQENSISIQLEKKNRVKQILIRALKLNTLIFTTKLLEKMNSLYVVTTTLFQKTLNLFGIGTASFFGGPNSLFQLFEKPGELIIDWIAYMFLVEWSSDIRNTNPENLDMYLGKTSFKVLRTVHSMNLWTLTEIMNQSLVFSTKSLFTQKTAFSFFTLSPNFQYGMRWEISRDTYSFEPVWNVFANWQPTLVKTSLNTNPLEINTNSWLDKSQKLEESVSMINKDFSLLSIGTTFIQRRFYHLYEILLFQIYQPDMDLNVRAKRGVLFWDIWGDFLTQTAEDSNINISELTSLKEEQFKLLEKCAEISEFNSQKLTGKKSIQRSLLLDPESKIPLRSRVRDLLLRGFSNRSLAPFKEGGVREKTLNEKRLKSQAVQENLWRFPSFKNQKESEKQNHFVTQLSKNVFFPDYTYHHREKRLDTNQFGVQQFLSYQGKDTELFIDLHPPKSLNRVRLLYQNETVQQPVGSLVCQIFAGLLSQQISKNILVVGSGSHSQSLEKTLLVQAIAGETELKIITDNAYRYAMVYRGVAVGIKLLRDVFDSLALHTPCLFLIEDIHAIGERRPLLISDDDHTKANRYFIFGSQREEIHEKNQILYQLSKHQMTHYRKPYKGDFSQSIPTNHFCFDLFRGSFTDSSIFSTSNFRNTDHHSNLKTLNFGGNVGFSNRKRLLSPKIQIESLKLEERTSGSTKKDVNSFGKKDDFSFSQGLLFSPQNQTLSSRLLMKTSDLLAPPATSPFSVLTLKEEKKFQPYKVVSEIPWSGLPNEQLAQISKTSYSIRVKVALLADMAISSLTVKLDMITDLLVIMDSVKGNRGFVVFATTHVPYLLDPALRRPGRLDETITLGLFPTLLCRWEILKSSFGLFNHFNTKGFAEHFGYSKGISLDFTFSLTSHLFQNVIGNSTNSSNPNLIQKNLKKWVTNHSVLKNTKPFFPNGYTLIQSPSLKSFDLSREKRISSIFNTNLFATMERQSVLTNSIRNFKEKTFHALKKQTDSPLLFKNKNNQTLLATGNDFHDNTLRRSHFICKKEKDRWRKESFKKNHLDFSEENETLQMHTFKQTNQNKKNVLKVKKGFLTTNAIKKILSQTYFLASISVHNAKDLFQKNSSKITRETSILSSNQKAFGSQWSSEHTEFVQSSYIKNKKIIPFIDSPLNGLYDFSSIYLSFYASPHQLKKQVVQLISGKLGEIFFFSKMSKLTHFNTLEEVSLEDSTFPKNRAPYVTENTSRSIEPYIVLESSGPSSSDEPLRVRSVQVPEENQQKTLKVDTLKIQTLFSSGIYTTYGLSNTWHILSSLIVSFVQKRFLYHQNLRVPKLLDFSNYTSLHEPPSPPSSNILLPARRYENYKRSFSFYSEQRKASPQSTGILEKLQFHQQQRLVKRLYRIPIQETYRSEIISNRMIGFSNASLMLGSLQKNVLQKPSRSNWFIKNRILKRHRNYLTNQWWNAQLPEHNTETTFLSDIDWRYTFIDSVGDLLLDFPDADSHYNPRNRRWFLTKGLYHNWFDFEKTLYSEIYSHLIFDSFVKAFHLFEKNRDVLDYYAFYSLKKGLYNRFQEVETIKLYQRFYM